jgi:hypothetical protein
MTDERPGYPDEPLEAVRRAAGRALVHATAYRARETLDEAQLASAMARRLGRLEESASALAAASLAHYYQVDLVDAVLTSLDALRRSRDDAQLARAAFAATLAFLAVEARDIARQCARRSHEHALAAGDAALLARAHFALGFEANESGEHDLAITHVRTAARLLRGHANRALAMKAVGNLGRMYRDRGNALEAMGQAARARRSWRQAARLFVIAARIPAPGGDRVIVNGSLAAVLERLGEAARAVPFADEAVSLLASESLPWLAAEARLKRARVRLALDDLVGAAEDLEAASAICRDDRAVTARADCHALNAELAERLGRRDKAAVFGAYSRTAKLRREEELAAARRQATALWERFAEGGGAGA